MNFLTSATSVFLLVAMSIPGYLLRKTNKIPEEFVGGIVTILLYVSLPALTIYSFAGKEYQPKLLINLVEVAVFSGLFLVLGFLISKLLFSGMPKTPEKKIYIASGFMNNCAFMGIPVFLVLFPGDSEPILYAAVFGVVFNMFTWTLLTYTLTGEKKYISIKKALINPPSLSLLVALPVFFMGWNIPSPLMTVLNSMGGLTGPLSMLVLGIHLADIRPGSLLDSPRSFESVAIKLIVIPVVSLGILLVINSVVPLDKVLISSLFLIMGMPTAFSVIMFSDIYGSDSGSAARIILISSIVSIITIPFLMLITQFI